MKEYNKFTRELFDQGYSFERYPDYARLPNAHCDRQLFDILGGFEFQNWYLNQKVYQTGCGLLCKGNHFSSGYMSYGGIDWKPENDNPVISCPYRRDTCFLRHPLLDEVSGGGLAKFSQCDCREAFVPYHYERSIERVQDEEEHLIREKYEQFKIQKKNHVCYWHSHYNYWTGQWQQSYDPIICAKECQNIGGTCDLKHTPISDKRGNVFYDVKITSIRHDGTLFDGQTDITVRKGCRFLETGTSITICEDIVRHCGKKILQKEQDRRHKEILFHGQIVEVSNIRAERRESRDLMQDLQDIKDGITVVHASDMEKHEKEAKRARRNEAKASKKEKLRKKIIQTGLENMDSYSLDYRHAVKWFDEQELENLKERRVLFLEEEKKKPIQMSLFEAS
ncbi:MAG: sarcolemmal membrane-associated protein [Monoglobales bacterium]